MICWDDYGELICASESADYEKDPESIEDFELPWPIELDGDTILTSTWESLDGLTIADDDFEDFSATVRVSGGSCGTLYCLKNTVTTLSGRTLVKTLRIWVTEQ